MASITKRLGNFKLYSYLMFMLLFLAIFMIEFSCDSSDDDDDEDDNNDDDDSLIWTTNPECENNKQTKIENVILLLNGIEAGQPLLVSLDDQLEIQFDYEDPDCNNEFVYLYVKMNATDRGNYNDLLDELPLTGEQREEYRNHDGHTYKIEDMACSSEEAGSPYRLNINPEDFLLPAEFERQYPFQFDLMDSCEFGGEPQDIPLDFTVVENK